MARDGTLRGNTPGNPRGAGRKRKPLADKIAEGSADCAQIISLPDLPEPPDLESDDMPPFDDFMSAPQKVGVELKAKDVAEQTWRWLKARGCANLINPMQLEEYAMCIARWIQCEMIISDKGFLAKHPTTGNPVTSPYVTAAQNFMRQANSIWFMIFQVVRENCSVAFTNISPQGDAMERLLQMRQNKRRGGIQNDADQIECD
jgi:hypothetical protein